MAKPRSKSQARRDRRLISELYLKGKRQYEIAEDVGVSVATVSRDIKILARYWQITSKANIDKYRTELRLPTVCSQNEKVACPTVRGYKKLYHYFSAALPFFSLGLV